ncbi:unnamed protein product [Nesidiocoris tenuis]|uniref:Uncharacterized protein n=1 Tax=Nesidiocoris tenuis TaxID=355587 RepID=A0A6H5GSW2_9HEMI|nr:unnamed protein product [Nesidiocoris tenuis]
MQGRPSSGNLQINANGQLTASKDSSISVNAHATIGATSSSGNSLNQASWTDAPRPSPVAGHNWQGSVSASTTGSSTGQNVNGQARPTGSMQAGIDIGQAAQQNAGTASQTQVLPAMPSPNLQINAHGQLTASKDTGLSVDAHASIGASTSGQNHQTNDHQGESVQGQTQQHDHPADDWWGLGQIDDHPQPVYVGVAYGYLETINEKSKHSISTQCLLLGLWFCAELLTRMRSPWDGELSPLRRRPAREGLECTRPSPLNPIQLKKTEQQRENTGVGSLHGRATGVELADIPNTGYKFADSYSCRCSWSASSNAARAGAHFSKLNRKRTKAHKSEDLWNSRSDGGWRFIRRNACNKSCKDRVFPIMETGVDVPPRARIQNSAPGETHRRKRGAQDGKPGTRADGYATRARKIRETRTRNCGAATATDHDELKNASRSENWRRAGSAGQREEGGQKPASGGATTPFLLTRRAGRYKIAMDGKPHQTGQRKDFQDEELQPELEPGLAAKLEPHFIFGLTSSIRGGTNFINDETIVRPIGRILVFDPIPAPKQPNVHKHSRRYVRVKSPYKVGVIAVSPDRQVLAVAIHGGVHPHPKAAVSFYDTNTLQRHVTIGCPTDNNLIQMYDHIAFTEDGEHLVAITGEPDGRLIYYKWRSGGVVASTRADGKWTGAASTITVIYHGLHGTMDERSSKCPGNWPRYASWNERKQVANQQYRPSTMRMNKTQHRVRIVTKSVD